MVITKIKRNKIIELYWFLNYSFKKSGRTKTSEFINGEFKRTSKLQQPGEAVAVFPSEVAYPLRKTQVQPIIKSLLGSLCLTGNKNDWGVSTEGTLQDDIQTNLLKFAQVFLGDENRAVSRPQGKIADVLAIFEAIFGIISDNILYFDKYPPHIMDKVISNNNLKTQNQISAVTREIEPQLCESVMKNFIKRVTICNKSRGGHLSDIIFHYKPHRLYIDY
nr:unnamed protein product [Callosobruchus analis]